MMARALLGLVLGLLVVAPAARAQAPHATLSAEVLTFHCKPSVTRLGQGLCKGSVSVRLDTGGDVLRTAHLNCRVPVHFLQGAEGEPGVRTLELEADVPGQGAFAEQVLEFETDLTSIVKETRNARVGAVSCRARWNS